jgi:hypothetical protein
MAAAAGPDAGGFESWARPEDRKRKNATNSAPAAHAIRIP